MLKNRIRELRVRERLTQTELATKIGVSRQTIGFIEKGDYSPSVVLALKIAQVFQLPLEEVFWLEQAEED
ncbi:helix-turn-helix transcriptional regulator [Thermoflavimicrobium daqui]|uniref:Transcriptional regulator n=1 Tax=Thermoflavimicrobium daqui TaxID=2137476 RepID=A0A364K8P5_9BACL|nr:helix-turn-helix transcriptional regulator [Thermoflavimicrobium daqui]RAL26669.1 transcriptional regulator [Thermoflavimicrobium daqui]